MNHASIPEGYNRLSKLIPIYQRPSLKVTVKIGYQPHTRRKIHSDSAELFWASYEIPFGALFFTFSDLRDSMMMNETFPLPPSFNKKGYMSSAFNVNFKTKIKRERIWAYTTKRPHKRNSYNKQGRALHDVIPKVKQKFIEAIRTLFESQLFTLEKDVNNIHNSKDSIQTMKFSRTSTASRRFEVLLRERHPYVFRKYFHVWNSNSTRRGQLVGNTAFDNVISSAKKIQSAHRNSSIHSYRPTSLQALQSRRKSRLETENHYRQRALAKFMQKFKVTDPSFLHADLWAGHRNMALPILGGDTLVFQGHGGLLNTRHKVPKGVRILFPCREGEKTSTLLHKGVWPNVTATNYKNGRLLGYKRTNRAALRDLMKTGNLERYKSYLENSGFTPEIRVPGNSYADQMLYRFSKKNRQALGANNTSVNIPNEAKRRFKLSNIIAHQLQLRKGRPFDLIVHACRSKHP